MSDDENLWTWFTKGIKRLERKTTPPACAQSQLPPRTYTPPKARKNQIKNSYDAIDNAREKHTISPLTTADLLSAYELDKRTDQRLRRGKINIDGRIDLHGMSRIDAQDKVRRYIMHAYQNQKRCILVITGKGRLNAPSVIKQNLPHWLREPSLSRCILKIYPAQPKHGGAGAFYVYLRRQR